MQRLQTPFRGRWMMLRPPKMANHKAVYVKLDKRGKLYPAWASFGHLFLMIPAHTFYSYNEEIYSPVGGKIIDLTDDIEDRPLWNAFTGLMRWYSNRKRTEEESIEGNRVVLSLGDGAFLVLAGFKKASITKKLGDSVEAGECLGHLGASAVLPQPGLLMYGGMDWGNRHRLSPLVFTNVTDKNSQELPNFQAQQSKSFYC